MFAKAQKYYETSLKMSTDNHLQNLSVVMYRNNIADGENNLGNLLSLWEKKYPAKLHYLKGLEIAESVDYKLLQTDLSTNLGNVSKDLNDFPKAEKYCKRSEKLYRELNQEVGLQTACVNLGGLYLV